VKCPRRGLSELIDEVISAPFEWLARGPAKFYCLGLWLYLLEHSQGIVIEDPWQNPKIEVLRDFWTRFDEIPPAEATRPLDLLFWRWGPGQPHVATVEDDRWVVSVEKGLGVTRELHHEASARAERGYRLQVLA
jgi:hypothetical protein